MSDSVVKDSGARALLPPFTDEHEQLRDTIARWVSTEIAPHVDEWDEAGEFPASSTRALPSSDSWASSTPRSWAGRAATTSTTRSGPRRWPPRERAAAWAPGSEPTRDRHTAHLEVRHARPARALPPPCDRRREDRRAGHHRARRRLGRRRHPHPRRQDARRLSRQRSEDLHHERRPRRLRGHRGEDHA